MKFQLSLVLGGVLLPMMGLVPAPAVSQASQPPEGQPRSSLLAVGGPRDIRLDVIVSSTGNLTNDGKGPYSTGKDWVAAWLNPDRWHQMSFDICMDWPFSRWPGINSAAAPPASGTPGSRSLIHRLTDPVPGGGGKSQGVFAGPHSNDVALPKPLTSAVKSLTDMAIGSSVSPDSAVVRFCNSDCSHYYSLIFGGKSVFGFPKAHGKGTTKPTIVRTSETTWTIEFPPKTIGRLWDGAEPLPDLGLFYYEGRLELQVQSSEAK